MPNMPSNAVLLHFSSLSIIETSSNSDSVTGFVHRQACILLIAYVAE